MHGPNWTKENLAGKEKRESFWATVKSCGNRPRIQNLSPPKKNQKKKEKKEYLTPGPMTNDARL